MQDAFAQQKAVKLRKNLTSDEKYGMGWNSELYELRCWSCGKLSGKGHIEQGFLEMKCFRCSSLVTVGARRATQATPAVLKLVRN